MSFSLYGALPPSKAEKEQNANEKGQSPSSKPTSLSGLYASIPAPGTPLTTPEKPKADSKPVEIATTNTPTTTPTNTQTKPAGWAAFNTFRPVMRKPTIQAKPKLNRPVIPAGATIVSTMIVSKEEKNEEEKITIESKQPASNIDLGAIPLLTSAEDVNGFRAVQKPKKKGKKGKNNNNPQPIVFNMLEDYDPHKPNDYEQYKEERKELREQQRKKREWEKRRSRSRSRSPYYSDYSRSPTPEEDDYHHQPPQTKININESADDAYMRRAMLSQQQQRPDESTTQDVARKVLGKYGWQEGQGLGREKDGIKEALQVKTTGGGSGVIINNYRDEIISKVILLTNMVGPGEVDDMLQEETAEECGKYGRVERCLIFEVPHGKISDDRAVRIFVKFSETESARSAIADLDGRYFGGRVVSATSFDSARFDRLDLAPSPEEFL
ncbi:hypothetical protein K501DRAFT_220711 [Backusella circina FSU 941]|nr:hypothetical protein K501DRAFT_220711 [Backusella circina FSU 941]